MNNTIYKRGATLLILCLFGAGALSAQDYTDQSTLWQSYPATRETTLDLENKYGTVHLVPWDKDSVSIQVDIFLSSTSMTRLKRLKEDVNISFSSSRFYITARTILDKTNSQFSAEMRSLSNALIGTPKEVEINYLVHVPAYININLRNKFGDVYIDDLTGKVRIELSNGSLKANRIDGNSEITLSFANGMVNTLGSVKLDLSYSDLKVGAIRQLDLISRSSTLDADFSGLTRIDSRRDKLTFKEIEYLYGSSNFSQVWIDRFTREADCYMKYGGLVIDHVVPGFQKLHIDSDYTDITLNVEAKKPVRLELLHSPEAVVNISDKDSQLENSPASGGLVLVSGTLGGREGNGKIQIEALQKCFIKISSRQP
ncbi:MAG: hypothetical protein ACOYXB_12585 [Bacteroidota bacterium]